MYPKDKKSDMPLPEPVSGRCKPCNETGLRHCADPMCCTGMQWLYTADQIAARDAQWQSLLDAAVAAERERCALICESYVMRVDDAGLKLAAEAIRASRKEST